MDLDDLAYHFTTSRSLIWLRRTGSEAHSMESPNSNSSQHTALQKSLSLPYSLSATDPAVDIAGGMEDATLYYIPAPSCADLTACASEILSNLAPSASRCFFKATLASAVSMVRLAPTQTHCVDTVRISKSDNFVDQFSLNMRPTDNHKSPGEIPSIPSILSSSSVQHIKFCASPPPQAHPLLSYGFIGTLGKGTYGKVVLACMKDDMDGELFAVKIVRTQGKHDIGPELATLQLVSNWSETSSDDGLLFLQRLREAFRQDDSLFIVMEYHPATLSDHRIASRFRIKGPPEHGLSPSASLPLTFSGYLSLPTSPSDETVVCLRLLIAEISLGLAFLHHRGIVHQDIKPANILVSFTGHAVIGDFGAATRMPLIDRSAAVPPSLGDYTAYTQSRRYGSVVLRPEDFVTFTPLYAAPELRERNSAGLLVYNERSDWWGLGILLYELVTGVLPFQVHPSGGADVRDRRSDGDCSLAFGALEVLSGPFKAAKSGWYPCLEDFLRSLLSHDPNDRLSWPGIKNHAFLDPLRGLWTDIANLRCPPCPDPPTSYVDDDTSLTVDGEDDVELCNAGPNATRSPQRSHCGEGESDLQGGISLDDVFSPSLHISLVQPRHLTPHFPDDDDGSDDASIPQPMPSSASLWWAAERPREYPASSQTFLENHDSCLADAPLLQSPFSSMPILSPLPQHSSVLSYVECSSLKTAHYPLAPPDSVVPEEITISLLEAMDNRDRAALRDQRGDCEVKNGPARRMRSTTLGRLWKKLLICNENKETLPCERILLD